MKIFKHFRGPTDKSDKTVNSSACFFLGSPEAEAESTTTSRMKLDFVFDDFLGVLPQLDTEKFIVLGRKGAGKSAIGENIFSLAEQMSNTYCSFIRKRDIDIETIVQIGKENDSAIQYSTIFEWIILMKMVELLCKSEAVKSIPYYNHLQKFLRKNSGYVQLNDYQVKEMIQNKGFDLQIEYFKRFFDAAFHTNYEIRTEKAPFYKLLPGLRETVKYLLEIDNNKVDYLLIFDDLDIGFKRSNPMSIKAIIELLRIAKEFNIEYFGKHGLNAKVLLLLRSDISYTLCNYDSDIAKIFASYSIYLHWYQHAIFKHNENNLSIKKFINRRIGYNFKINKIPYDINDPWSSFIIDHISGKSSFKKILDYTFFRPRDLLLFFLPLQQFTFPLPLSIDNLNALLRIYSGEIMKEIKNELSMSLTPDEVENCFELLKKCNSINFTHEYLLQMLKDSSIVSMKPSEIISLLFEYSLIGNIVDERMYFKYREDLNRPIRIDINEKLVLHNILFTYFENKYKYF